MCGRVGNREAISRRDSLQKTRRRRNDIDEERILDTLPSGNDVDSVDIGCGCVERWIAIGSPSAGGGGDIYSAGDYLVRPGRWV